MESWDSTVCARMTATGLLGHVVWILNTATVTGLLDLLTIVQQVEEGNPCYMPGQPSCERSGSCNLYLALFLGQTYTLLTPKSQM